MLLIHKVERGPGRSHTEESMFCFPSLGPGDSSLQSSRVGLLDTKPPVLEGFILIPDEAKPVIFLARRNPIWLGENACSTLYQYIRYQTTTICYTCSPIVRFPSGSYCFVKRWARWFSKSAIKAMWISTGEHIKSGEILSYFHKQPWVR